MLNFEEYWDDKQDHMCLQDQDLGDYIAQVRRSWQSNQTSLKHTSEPEFKEQTGTDNVPFDGGGISQHSSSSNESGSDATTNDVSCLKRKLPDNLSSRTDKKRKINHDDDSGPTSLENQHDSADRQVSSSKTAMKVISPAAPLTSPARDADDRIRSADITVPNHAARGPFGPRTPASTPQQLPHTAHKPSAVHDGSYSEIEQFTSMSMMAAGDLASTPDITARFPQRMLPLEHGVNAPKLPPGDGAGIRAADSSYITTPASSAKSAASSSKIDAVAPATKAAKKRSSAAPKKGKTRKTKELVTPLEYAKRLQAKFAEDQANGKSPASHTLRGKRIYYFGGDMNYAGESTRGRMDYIMKHGGTLVPVYDPAQMTHIVTDASAPVLLRALGLRSLEEIPKHIPTVTWDWVLSVRRPSESGKETAANAEHGENAQTDYVVDDNCEVELVQEIMHAAYKQRIDAGMSFRVNAARPKQGHATAAYRSNAAGAHHPALDSGEISSISEFTEDNAKISGARGGEGGSRSLRPSPSAARQLPQVVHPSAGGAGPYTVAPRNGQDIQPPSESNDPLAEFYAQARAERESDLLRSPSDGESDSASEPGAQKPPTHDAGREATVQRGFLCDAKGTGLPAPRCANQDVIDKLEELMELHKSKLSDEDRWRVFSYGKAIRALRSCPERIRSYEQAKAIKGVGDKTARKIMEILETGDLRRIYYERTDDVDAVNLFMGIYGVGRNIAHTWYSNGCRTLDDVKARKGGIKLTAAQEIGLRHYADINSRMPRSEAAEIFEMIKPIALAIDPKLFIEIMGSYRRGKADCGDIDILITRPTDDGKTHQGVLLKLLRELHCQGIVTEDLCLPDDFNDLELVYRGLCRRDSKSPRRRIDFLTVPYTSRGAALLYYTGDDIFNRSLRLKANVMGYSLNQRGLYAGVVRDPRDRRQKLDDGSVIASETEREILDILGVPWQEPHERVRG